MKQTFKLLSTAILTLTMIFYSCNKDDTFESSPIQLLKSLPGMENYDDFGPKLEIAIDRLLDSKEVQSILMNMVNEKPTGDFEVLFTSFIKSKLKDGSTIMDELIRKSESIFNLDDLESFTSEYPSLIIAVRGNMESMEDGTHNPPSVFVPSGFQEISKSIEGTFDGNRKLIALDHYFEDAVVVMHMSERHNREGIPFKDLKNNQSKDFVEAGPCDGCPTECPDLVPIVKKFEIENANGAFLLNYEIDNFPESMGQWGVVEITKIGPPWIGNSTFIRKANDINYFYDTDLVPNGQYNYFIKAYATYYSSKQDGPLPGYQDGIVSCEESNEMEVSATSAQPLPKLSSFIGENLNNSIITYQWDAPDINDPVAEYRLRRRNPDNGIWEEICDANTGACVIPGNGDLNFAYNYDPEDRGKHVDVQIQYRNTDQWGGDFRSKVYGSERNPYEPLRFYGFALNNWENYEVGVVGESLLFGAPEISFLSAKGSGFAGNFTTTIMARDVYYTTQCGEDIFKFDNNLPIDILNSWDPSIDGTAITIKLAETDLGEIVTSTQTNGETKMFNINGTLGLNYGMTIGGNIGIVNSTINTGIDLSFGIGWTHTTTESTTVQYPKGDIYLSEFTLYYHEPREYKHSAGIVSLFGNLDDQYDPNNICQLLNDKL